MDGPGGGRADRPDGTVRTNLVDIEARQVTHCAVTWRDGVITATTPTMRRRCTWRRPTTAGPTAD